MADSGGNTILITIKLDDALTAPFDAVMAHIDQRVAQAAQETTTASAKAEAPHQKAAAAAAKVIQAHAPAAEASQRVVESEQQVGDKAEEAGGKLTHAAGVSIVAFDALKQSVEGVARLISGGRISQAIGAFQEMKGVEEFGAAAEHAAEEGGSFLAMLGRIAPAAAAAAAAIGAVAAEGAHLAKEASHAALEIDDLQRVSGLSTEKVLALRKTMAEGGVEPQSLQLALRGLATRVQESWASIGDNVRDAADKQTGAILSIKEAYRGYAESLDGIRSAAIDAAEAQDKLADSQAGVKNAKFDAEQASIDKTRAEIHFRQFNGERIDPEQLAQLNRREEVLKLRRAEERADEAPRRVREAEADEQKAELGPARAQRNLEAAQDTSSRAAIGVRTATNAEHDLRRDSIPDIEGGNVDLREVASTRLLDVMIHKAMTESVGHPEAMMQHLIEEIAKFTQQAQTSPQMSQAATGLIRQFLPRGDIGGVERGLSNYLQKGRAVEGSEENQKDAALVRGAITKGESYQEAAARKTDATELSTMGLGARVTDPVVNAMDAFTAGINGSRDKLISAAGGLADGFQAAGTAAKKLAEDLGAAAQSISKAGPALPTSTIVDKDYGDRKTLYGGNPETEREATRAASFAAMPAPKPVSEGEDAQVRAAKAGEAQGAQKVGEASEKAAAQVGAFGNAVQAATPKAAAKTAAAGDATEATEAHALGGPILIPGHADGGMIRGPGTGTSDSVFRYLHEGDFVIKASATEKLGHTLLDKINAGTFASGGKVPAYVSNGEYHIKSSAVEKYGLPLMHWLNGVGHAEGGEIRRFADGGGFDDINAITGEHVGILNDDKWKRILGALNRFNRRGDVGSRGSVSYGTGADTYDHNYHASAGAPTAQYKPATQGASKVVDAPNAAAQAAANVAKKPEGEAPHVPGAPVEHAVPPTTGVLPGPLGEMLRNADRPAALPVLQTGQVEGKPEAAPRLPEVHAGTPPDIVLPGTTTEHHAKFDADISPSYRKSEKEYGPSLSMSAGDSKPWHPGELGLGGADFYIPEGDKRVLVQTDRARDKAEMRPAGTHGGVRMDKPLFEHSEGIGNVTFSNQEEPLYGDAATWSRYDRNSVSAGTRTSHEKWDRRHPEDDPGQGLYSEGGSILGDVIQHFASGGLAGGATGAAEGGSSSWLRWDKGEDGAPRLRLAIGGLAGQGGVMAPPGFTAPTAPGDTFMGGWTGLLQAPAGSPLGRGWGFSGNALAGIDAQSLTQNYAQMLTASLSAGHEQESLFGGSPAQVQAAMSGSAGERDLSGYHSLDLTTDQGRLSALVSDTTVQAIKSSAIGARLTSTGSKPSWMSGG